MSSQLRLTAQGEADAWQQSAEATVEHAQEQASNGRSLAAVLAAQRSRLEAADARFGEWSARTTSTREIAGKAKAELQRRGQQPSAGGSPGPQSMATWWREFQANADAMDRAIEREHQVVVYDGQKWPPERRLEAGHEEPDTAVPRHESQLEEPRPGIPGFRAEPEAEASKPRGPQAGEPFTADDGRAARLDELQARADQAARRITAQRQELDVSSKHTARTGRDAEAEPAADRQAETPHEMEMEL
jgi:hypothetical protein